MYTYYSKAISMYVLTKFIMTYKTTMNWITSFHRDQIFPIISAIIMTRYA